MKYGSPIQRQLFNHSPSLVKNLMASVYGAIQARHHQGGSYSEHFARLEEIQWWSNRELEEYQFEQTQSFVKNAVQTSPYFKDLTQELSFNPKSISDVSELAQLPILSKDILRAKRDSIISSELPNLNAKAMKTGGTTGKSVSLYVTQECIEREYAYRFQNYTTGGIYVGDRWAFCAGHPVADIDRTRPPFWVRDYVNNWLLLSSYHMTEENLEHYLDALCRFAPDLLGGYPSSVYLLALANEQCGRKLKVKAVYTASETLFDFQRAAIERSFGCKAYTYYGNTECAGYVTECPEGSLHLRTDHSYVELIKEDGSAAKPGESGRLICTAFGNEATPLIRL